jgi:hypothetical protein
LKTVYTIRLLLFGFLTLSFGLYLSSQSWVWRSDLVPVSGKLSSAEIYSTNVESRGTRSRKSELIFFLVGIHQKFRFSQNIGEKYGNPFYYKIQEGLYAARTVTVYIRPSELQEYEPKVYQIDTDRGTLIDFESIRTEDSSLAILMLVLGVGSFVMFFYFRNKSFN